MAKEKIAIKKLALYFRPVHVFNYKDADGKMRTVEVDAVTGDVHKPSVMVQKLRGAVPNKDTLFDMAAYHASDDDLTFDAHAFVGIIDRGVVAFVVLERRSHVARRTWAEWHSRAKKDWDSKDAAQWTIGFAWTAKKFRARGIARRTIQIVASWANCQVQELAWYTPFTASGERLVRKLCPQFFLIGR